MHKLTLTCLTITYLALGLAGASQAAQVDNLTVGQDEEQLAQMLCSAGPVDADAAGNDVASLVRMSENSALCGAKNEAPVLIDFEQKDVESGEVHKSLLEEKEHFGREGEEIDIEKSGKDFGTEGTDVPVPASMYFLVSGLIGLTGMGRMRQPG
jgi:hypothetical protein